MGREDELPFVMDELRDLIREAHVIIKDLRQLAKEASLIREELPAAVKMASREEIRHEVLESLEAYRTSLKDTIEDATIRVYERFDKIAAHIMGEDGKSRRAGFPSIVQMIDAIEAAAEARVQNLPAAFKHADSTPPPWSTSVGSHHPGRNPSRQPAKPRGRQKDRGH